MNDQQNNWTKLETSTKYENPWIEVEHNEVLNPAGGKGIYGVVNFKNIATGIVPLDAENNTWLVGQFRFPIKEYSWEIPEGGCPLHENPLDAAQRELKEETGLLANKWTQISKIHTSNSVCNEVGYMYLAEEISFSEAQPEETEVLKIKKLPLTEAIKMVMNDQITDSISVAALLKVGIIKGLI